MRGLLLVLSLTISCAQPGGGVPSAAGEVDGGHDAPHDAHQVKERLAEATRLIERCPGDAMNHHARGLLHFANGDNGLAIQDFTEAIRLDPGLSEAYVLRASARFATGQSADGVLGDLAEAIRLDPKNAAAREKRGFVHLGRGTYDAALSDFDEAIRLEPHSAEAFEGRGLARWFKDQQWDRSSLDLDEAVRLAPGQSRFYCSRALLLAQHGDCAAAQDDFSRAIVLDPGCAAAYQGRGTLSEQAGDVRAAISDFSVSS